MKDHNELGKELDLFVQSPAVGKGLPLLTPRGTAIKMALQRYIEDLEISRGYEFTSTPYLARKELYEISGHWELYRKNMFTFRDAGEEGAEYALRPMTCPFQFQIYLSRQRSYRELPIRYAETSVLFRNEESGALHGLTRICQFTLSEGHIICREDQIEKEFLDALALVKEVMGVLAFDDYWFRFSTRGDKKGGKYIDNPAAWKRSERKLEEILEKTGERYVTAPGEAAFYGPKLDIQMKDSWGREETLFTLQLDFALPERFGMTYMDENNREAVPFVIHRSSIGCYERTMALLLERNQGRLPFWMSPELVRVLPVSENHLESADQLKQELVSLGIRASVDSSSEGLGKKIRRGYSVKAPVLVVIGDKEQEENRINLRFPGKKEPVILDRKLFSGICSQALSSKKELVCLIEQQLKQVD